jgi:hypothetical protein
MTIAVASGIQGMGNLQRAMGTMIAIVGYRRHERLKELNEALSAPAFWPKMKGYGLVAHRRRRGPRNPR